MNSKLYTAIIFGIIIFIGHELLYSANNEESFEKYYKLVYQENNKEDALKYAFRALEIAQNSNNDSLIASGLFAVSNIYKDLGNLPSALDYSLKAKPIYEKINEEDGKVMLYLQIASIYIGLKNFQLAISYLKKAYQNIQKYKQLYIAINLNLADIYRKIDEFDTALYRLDLAENFIKQQNNDVYIGYFYANKGLLYAELNKTFKSDSLIKLSVEKFLTSNDLRPLSETYLDLAKINLKFNRKNKALLYAENTYNIADTVKLYNLTTESSRILSDLYFEKGNYLKAYKFLNISLHSSDKYSADSASSKIAEMRAEFEISQNQAQLNYLKKISQVRTKLLLLAVIALILIVALTLFLFRLSKKRKEANNLLKEYNEEITQQNEEITQQNEVINAQLEEKDILMKEIHHRVKNNLQIISSIINLQSMRISEPDTLEIFGEMQRRIMAISSIHQKLYQGNSVTQINMKEYLSEVVDATHIAFNNANLEVNYEIAVQNVNLNIDYAVSLGLIVNELATNAYKYAFKPGRNNHLLIGLQTTDDQHCILTVKDSGPGLPENFSFDKSKSLGLRMVSLLTKQLKGRISFENKNGTSFLIDFEEVKAKTEKI